ncbi:MAG: LuxR C-terminal-related transcriptional regulator, partial [Dehalococcoidia bacterium]
LQTAAALVLGLIDLDKRDEARALFERYAPGFAGMPANYLRLGALSLFSLACAELGDAQNAGVLYELLRPFTGHYAVLGLGIGSLGAMDGILGMLAALLRRWVEAQTHFEVALAANDRLGARPWAAETRVAYAAMLLGRGASGDFDDAAHLLTHAAAAGNELGMTSLIARARTLRERVETARRIATTLEGSQEAGRTPAPGGLTRREVEVLALVAAGHTNKEIAERLILSPLTVTRHITNIYAKIDARGRADATTFALRHGLVTLDRLDRADPPAPSSK